MQTISQTAPEITNFFQDQKALWQFIAYCKCVSVEQGCRQIASISLGTKPIDPLTFIELIQKPSRRCFYFERREGSEVLAGAGVALDFKTQGSNRFLRIKEFVNASLANIIRIGDLHLPFSGPHFFCNFTFFDRDIEHGFPFPVAMVFLPTWQVARSGDQSVVVANLAIDLYTNVDSLTQEVWRTYQKLGFFSRISLSTAESKIQESRKPIVIDTESFKAAVAAATRAIQANEFKKIVLAHVVDLTSLKPFHPLVLIRKLRRIYPSCYLFCTSNGLGQSFVGASPERLVSLNNRELSTEALAGSAPRGKTTGEDKALADVLLSSIKDLHEHRIVCEAIATRLTQLGIESEQLSRPNLLQLSNIQHLHTPIWAEMPKHLHLLDILDKLHPTPAVGGEPRDITYQQIRRYESFERGLYAAPIGWIDHRGNGEFAVAIRSALLNGFHARVYAGNGIVSDSSPQQEAEEIRLKFLPLMEALS